jgi:hypothetical protein
MKIVLCEGPHLRASSRDGGQGVFFYFFLNRSDAQEAPSGAGAIIVPDGESGNNTHIIAE